MKNSITSPSTIISINPSNLEEVWRGSEDSVAAVDEKIKLANEAYENWSRSDFDDRLKVIYEFTELIEKNKDELTEIIVLETGKTYQDAKGEVSAMIGKTAAALMAYKERSGESSKEVGANFQTVSYKPHGVLVVFGPFNFPAHLPNGHIIPALLAGNTIIFKPSEQTPKVGEFMINLWHQTAIAKNVIDIIQGSAKISDYIVRHDEIAGVLFTGGVEVGRKIHQALAGKVEKVLALELGGNNPLVVWDYEDAKKAAEIIIQSAYISSGQRCSCARRLIIEDNEKGQDLILTLINEIKKIRVDKPDQQNDPFYGPVISKRSADTILSQQDKLIKAGAKPYLLSKRVFADAKKVCFISPGLIDTTDIKEREDFEIFGPVLQVVRVNNFDQAIYFANQTKFGLASGLISKDKNLFDKFSKEIRAGLSNYNLPTTGASPYAPFGGIGLSGNHRPAGYFAADYVAWPQVTLKKNTKS